MRNIFIFGTRPEAIKMIPLILEFRKRHILFDICITGQHSMVLNILKTFGIKADYNLKIMKNNQTLDWIISATILEMNKIIDYKKYKYCLVHGDTTSALASSLAAFHNNVKVVHIESGLRSHNKYDPFPEEMNRILIDQISYIHFAPTKDNKKNLLKEGINPKHIYISGNTVVDMLMYILKSKKTKQKNEILFTCHRRENIKHLETIFNTINDISIQWPNYNFIYPMHPNQIIREKAKSLLKNKNIFLIEPLDYKEFIIRLSTCKLIITDSGGVLEESSFLHKPTIIIRNSLERNELLSSSIIRSNINKKEIINNFTKLINIIPNNDKKHHVLGQGNASEKILDILLKIK